MPIRPEFRRYYGREWLGAVRPRILARAGNKCEVCGKPNGQTVQTRTSGGNMWWKPDERYASWRSACGEQTDLCFRPEEIRRVRVVLTVAHLNHDPADNRDENLKALCQWCHLNYDKDHHKQTRSERKDRMRPLLTAVAQPQ